MAAIASFKLAYPSAGALLPALREFVRQQPALNDAQRVEFLLSSMALLGLMWRFEGIETGIMGSQVKALEHLHALDTESEANLKARFYDPVFGKLAAVANLFSFDKFLGFLIAGGLLELHEGTARITQLGRDYLAWRVQARKLPKLL